MGLMRFIEIIERSTIEEIQPPFMSVTVGLVDRPQLCKLKEGDVIKIQYVGFYSAMCRRGFIHFARTTDGDYIYDTGGHALYKEGDKYIRTYLLGRKEQSFYHIRKPIRKLIKYIKAKRGNP